MFITLSLQDAKNQKVGLLSFFIQEGGINLKHDHKKVQTIAGGKELAARLAKRRLLSVTLPISYCRSADFSPREREAILSVD